MELITLIMMGSSALLAWAVRAAIDRSKQRDIERLKAELQSRRDLELARLDTDRRRIEHDERRLAFEHETRFAEAHAQRAKVLRQTYGLVRRLHAATFSLVNPAPGLIGSNEPEAERRRVWQERWDALTEYLLDNAIDLGSLEPPIEVYLREVGRVVRAWAEAREDQRRQWRGDRSRDRDGEIEAMPEMRWWRAWQEVQVLERVTLATITALIRRLLGITDGADLPQEVTDAMRRLELAAATNGESARELGAGAPVPDDQTADVAG